MTNSHQVAPPSEADDSVSDVLTADVAPADAPDFEPVSSALMGHLIELRRRLVWSLCAMLAFGGIAYAYKEPIFHFLARPLLLSLKTAANPQPHLVFTGTGEAFFAYVKLSSLLGFLGGMPVVLWHLWRFVAPGLYETERKVLFPLLLATPLLFYAGAAFTYYAVIPFALSFFYSFQGDTLQAMPSFKEYLSFLVSMSFAFGLSFELPVFLTVLALAGVVTAEGLASFRRYAVVLIFIAAAVLTPSPDALSQTLLAVPMMLLYEVGILMSRRAAQKNRPS